jgi:hypothetical protein
MGLLQVKAFLDFQGNMYWDTVRTVIKDELDHLKKN